MAPHTLMGCMLDGKLLLSAPMVKKLSNSISGKAVKNSSLMATAFHPAASAELYHPSDEVDASRRGLLSSPEQDTTKSKG